MFSETIRNALRVPRKGSKAYAASLEPKYALVRKHGKSRKAMVEFICGIGGYSDRYDRYAIEFSVKAHYADTDVDNLWHVARDDCDFGIADMPPAKQVMAEHLFREQYAENADNVWQWGVEEAREGWEGSDCPYENWTGVRVEWSWSFLGRQGGHLVMTACEGIDLQRSDDDLRDLLLEKEDGRYVMADDEIAKLFIICVQNSVELTPREVSKEVEYRAAWRLWTSFCEDELGARMETYELRERLNSEAGRIKNFLDHYSQDASLTDALTRICQLAGVAITEE